MGIAAMQSGPHGTLAAGASGTAVFDLTPFFPTTGSLGNAFTLGLVGVIATAVELGTGSGVPGSTGGLYIPGIQIVNNLVTLTVHNLGSTTSSPWSAGLLVFGSQISGQAVGI